MSALDVLGSTVCELHGLSLLLQLPAGVPSHLVCGDRGTASQSKGGSAAQGIGGVCVCLV